MRKLTLLPLFLLFSILLAAQIGCPNCAIQLPDGIAEDTIYLSDLPDGSLGSPYNADVSFRLPKTTTPVAERDSTVIGGLTIDEIIVTNIQGLPDGLIWEANQDTFNVREVTDGCAKFCGIPQSRGLFMVEVTLESRVFVVRQESSVFIELYIGPSTSSTDGFSLENNIACGSARVRFRNNNPSQGDDGFQYFWDFGNGKTSTEENPDPQDYVGAGEYVVNYQAIIDTSESRLQGVTILEGDCTDLIGRPDYYISITDPDGVEIYVAQHFENPILPLTFELDIPLREEGNYILQVNDEDRGLEGSDDNCATIPFTFQDSSLILDGVVATLDILNPIDTINASDTIFVYSFPAAPSIAVSAEPNLCAGDMALLKVTPYEENLQWSKDGQIIVGANETFLEAQESGRYTVSYTAPGGCIVVAMPVDITINSLPVEPVFDNTDNLLALLEEDILNDNLNFQWYLNGEVIEGATEIEFCAESSGTYTLELTNTATNCVNTFSQEVVVDPSIVNCNISAVQELVLQNFKLYPNPTNDWVYIEFSDLEEQTMELRIMDILGRVQQQQWVNGNIALDLGSLPSGVYWLQMSSEGKILSRKIVKQ